MLNDPENPIVTNEQLMEVTPLYILGDVAAIACAAQLAESRCVFLFGPQPNGVYVIATKGGGVGIVRRFAATPEELEAHFAAVSEDEEEDPDNVER